MTKELNKTKKRYFLVDKVIVNEKSILTFDLFVKNELGKIVPVYKKGTVISAEEEKKLLSQKSLYVFEGEKGSYEEFHKEFMNRTIVPEDVGNLYQDVTKSVDKMFENPESLGNVKEAKKVVDNMMEVILADDFTVTSFISILSHDYYTHTHSLNVSVYALCLGRNIGLQGQELEDLGTAGLLHDLGKSKVDKGIINKNGKLTEEEFQEIKNHTVYGWEIAKKLGIENEGILCGIRHHQEKLDGSGYPDNLAGKEIHQFARIIAICDVFDALTTKRSYKDPMGTFNTLLMMKKDMAAHLDGDIVNRFIKIFKDENNMS